MIQISNSHFLTDDNRIISKSELINNDIDISVIPYLELPKDEIIGFNLGISNNRRKSNNIIRHYHYINKLQINNIVITFKDFNCIDISLLSSLGTVSNINIVTKMKEYISNPRDKKVYPELYFFVEGLSKSYFSVPLKGKQTGISSLLHSQERQFSLNKIITFSYGMNNSTFEIGLNGEYTSFNRRVFFIGNLCILFDKNMRATAVCLISFCNNKKIMIHDFLVLDDALVARYRLSKLGGSV